MKRQTKKVINTLFATQWFFAVGERAKGVVRASDWAEAAKSCISQKWQDTCLEADNLLRENIYANSNARPERINRWNEIVDEMEAAIVPKVKATLEPLASKIAHLNEIESAITQMIIGYGMELEYNDLIQPGFYSGLADWLMRGRFPCGWQGEYPKGKLVVY